MSIDKCYFCDYVTQIDWMRLFDESLEGIGTDMSGTQLTMNNLKENK